MADRDEVSSAPIELRLKWDVFLSFRGEDTRTTFIEHLYTALNDAAAEVRVFRDNEGMNRGDEIGASLLAAIEDSAVAIAVISRRYASSHWCLEELAKLSECKKLILPVFYGVNPSDVRHQRGPFAEGFEAHESRFPKERIESWRQAMKKVGGVSGWVASISPLKDVDRDQQLLIQILVKEILKLLSRTPMAVPQFMSGLDSRLTHLLRVLEAGSPNNVKILALHGMGGIGKTTLAKALFNKLVAEFEFRGFISDIRKVSAEDDGLLTLQNKLISSLSNRKATVTEISEGRRAIKRTVQERPVLVVLDDVDDASQLDALIGNKDWFHSGSRIVITTRETEALQSRRGDIELYEVRELGYDDALKLFCFHALKRETSTGRFADISRQIVSLMGGLPLSLEVFGCFLTDKRRMEEWEAALQRLKVGLPTDVYYSLRISYDGLEERDRSIFLDIACLFVNSDMTRDEAVDILDGCGYEAETAVKTLIQKSLIKVRDDDSLSVHDQLRDMGREIVLSGNREDPGNCSRLWDRREILSVLRDGKGTRNVQGIALDYKAKMPIMDPTDERILWRNFLRMPNLSTLATFLHEICKKFVDREEDEDDNGVILNTVYFQHMINLKLLQINLVKLEGKFKLLPQSLKWLQWRGSPLKVLPSDFCPDDLAVLDLTDSQSLERLWNTKVGGNLKIINLRGCANLQVIPDLSGSQNLEKLILERCVGLTQLHHSIGRLRSLRHLNLRNCSKLTILPSDVSGLKHLESLVLSGCGNLKVLPDDLGNLTSLKELLLDQTALTELPRSLFRLEKLEKLDLSWCSALKLLTGRIGLLRSLKELILDGTGIDTIPDSIDSLENLEELSLRWCSSLTAIPDTIGALRSLRYLVTLGSQVETLPCSVAALPYLRTLSLGNCRFPSNFLASNHGGLNSLVELHLGGPSITNLPDQIGALKMLKRLEVRDCPSLEALPESIGSLFSLTTLIITNVMIKELPKSIENLEDLIFMELKKCSQLHRLPDSFGELKSLHHLWMEESGVVELPERFGNLSNLVTLQMGKNPRSSSGSLGKTEVTLPISFPNLISLQELNVRACRISRQIPDDFEKLVLLEKLDLAYNNFISLPSSMKGLSHLKNLILCHCTELRSLPPLPSRLENIDIKGCRAMESVSDLSELESLEELNMANCEMVTDVPGIQCLGSLRRLYMTGCNACSMVVKRQLSKVSLRNMRVLSMPGDKIPEWLHEEEVTYKPCHNRELKAILIAVVVSINHDFPEDLKDTPGLVDIQAKILRQQGELEFATALPLKGIAMVNEEQVHFCRFLDFHPLVSRLRDGYKVRVEIRNPPMLRGTELKKCGVHLVFDDEDDYGGDEKALEEREQSLSEKLARFLKSS